MISLLGPMQVQRVYHVHDLAMIANIQMVCADDDDFGNFFVR